MYGFDWIPAQEYVLTLYAVFLSRSFVSPGAVSNYVYGIKRFMVLLDLPISVLSSPSLKITLRGVARIKQHKPNRASPITPDILNMMFLKLDMNITFNIVTWALFCIAFFLYVA